MATKRPHGPRRGQSKRPPPGPAATAPDATGARIRAGRGSGRQDGDLQIARGAANPAMHDRKRREGWGLPGDPKRRGPYMVELNLLHPGGIEGAAEAFLHMLLPAVVGKNGTVCDRITSAYFRCDLSVPEWRRLIKTDEQWEAEERPSEKRGGAHWVRTIYRIWPDFEVKALTDRSVATVKADAAYRSFLASGKNIVWAVIDSGIEAGHAHFGSQDDAKHHRLLHEDVADLHRDFTRPGVDQRPTPKENVASALKDEYGHGTHVAGIISGHAPKGAGAVRTVAFERVFKPTSDELHDVTLQERPCEPDELRGVAPECRLVSLRVLGPDGRGRSSDIIRALAYIREYANSNPKMPRIHGANLSLGYEFDAEMFACGQSPLCAEVDRLVQSGVVVVAAAGNTGYGTASSISRSTRIGMSNSINDPGNAARAITVGATHREFPHTYGVSYFSSKGPTGDGRLKPDLVAPGERITSCAAGQKLAALPLGQALPRGRKAASTTAIAAYTDDSGTSMAAPHVSGAIAAFLSIRREFIGKPDEIKRVFLDSATSLGRERYFEGHGLVDLMRAIQSI